MIIDKQNTEAPFNGTLVYRFLDASVPPQYHRSFTITVDAEKVKMTVDSYGTILTEYQSAFSAKAFAQFAAEIQQTAISNRGLINDDGCTGGTTDSFRLLTNTINVNGYIYHCGRSKYGNLCGDTNKAVRLFKALVPGFEKKLKVK